LLLCLNILDESQDRPYPGTMNILQSQGSRTVGRNLLTQPRFDLRKVSELEPSLAHTINHN